VLAWVQETQPAAWETLTKNHGPRAAETLLSRVRDQLDQRGTLDVLRHGVELLGLRQPVKVAELYAPHEARSSASAAEGPSCRS
jgi:type I restriction enzyme R subunit